MMETRCFQIDAEKGIKRLDGREEAFKVLGEDGSIWIDVIDPVRDELEAIAGSLRIHPLVVEDCLDEDQIPKIEDYPGHTFILFNRYSYADQELKIEEIDLVLGRKFLVTVRRSGKVPDHLFARIEGVVELDADSVANGPDFLLHAVLDHIVDEKLGAIVDLETDIENAEEAMLTDLDSFRLENLVDLRHALLSLRKSLFHEREILVKICRKDSPYVSEKAIYHFRDIYDHLIKFFESCEMNRDILASLMETYLSLVNNRMSEMANRTNASVRRLTLITTVFMPLSLLAGIGGMSEWSMMTGPENWKRSYPIFLFLMAAIGLASYLILRWLEKKDRDQA
jgi:magnesium transporter